MAETETPQPKTFGEKLQSVPRQTLYLTLIAVISISLFLGVRLPNEPGDNAADFFAAVMSIPEGSTVILQSDFTLSTRGENAGQLESLVRILIRKKVKFALLSASDAQAPTVAVNIINLGIAKEHAEGTYKRWEDWVKVGFFPSAENTAKSLASDLAQAFGGRKDAPPSGTLRPVMESPVLKNVKTLDDVAMYINITGSKTLDILVQRLKINKPYTLGGNEFPSKLAGMCTGVMGPQSLNYYQAKQLSGLIVGLNGVVELETLMEEGLNTTSAKTVKKEGRPTIEGFKGKENYARGASYYFSLHLALVLLIIAVAAGNLGMYLTKKNSTGGSA